VDIATVAVSVVAVVIAAGALIYTWRGHELAQRADRREEAAMTSVLVEGGSIPEEWQGRRAYRFEITNAGRSGASDVDAWLIDQDCRVVSEPFSYEHSRIAGLLSGQSDEVVVVVNDDDRERNPLRLKVTWYGHSSSRQEEHISKAPIRKVL
jgi:hypothetical protein